MRAISVALLSVSMCGAAALAKGGGPMGQGLIFRGASDASAAVAVGGEGSTGPGTAGCRFILMI